MGGSPDWKLVFKKIPCLGKEFSKSNEICVTPKKYWNTIQLSGQKQPALLGADPARALTATLRKINPRPEKEILSKIQLASSSREGVVVFQDWEMMT